MTKKLGLDLTEKNRKTLEKIKKEQKIPYGTTINTLIDLFYNSPNSVKKELLDLIKKRLKRLHKEMENADVITLKEITEKMQYYNNMAAIFNNGKHLSKEEIDAVILMQKIVVKNGYLVCPDDWIVVNPEMAKNSKYASVIECNNINKLEIPHLLVFTESESVDKFDKAQVDSIYEMCCKAYPRFSEVLKSQAKHISNPNQPEKFINEEEAPNIRFFDIYIQEEPKYEVGYKPHADVQVIRNTP